MQFTNTLTNFFFFGVLATFATLFSLVSAAPVDILKRDVFVPPITYPHAGTVWAANSHHNVTWDTSSAPVNITNKQGEIFLRHNDLTDTSSLIEAARRIALYKSASSQNWMNGEETLVSVISARIFCEEMVMKVSKSKDAQMLKNYVEKGLESVGVQMWLEKYMKIYNWKRNKYRLKAKDWLNGLRKIKVIQQTNPFTSRQLRYEDGPSSSQHFAEMNTCTSDAVPNQYTTGSHISTLVSVSPSPAVLQRPPSYDTFYHEHSSLSTDELNLPITKGPNGMLNLKPPKGPRATLEAQSAGRAWFNMV